MSRKISIGSVADFPAGKAKVVNAEGTAVVINRVDDKFYAIENRCAHMGLPLGANKVEKNVLDFRQRDTAHFSMG